MAGCKTVFPLNHRERSMYYQIGSSFRGCAHCGSPRVMRAFCPGQLGWWHYCWDCSAKDQDCWPTDKSVWCKSAERERRDLQFAALIGDTQALEALPPMRRAAIEGAKMRAALAEKPFHEMTHDERTRLLIEQNRQIEMSVNRPVRRGERGAGRPSTGLSQSELANLIASLKAQLDALPEDAA